MAVVILDGERVQYWSKLTVGEKESLLALAKNYVRARGDDSDTSDLRKKIIQQERENYLQGKGQCYSWKEVKSMALDKSERDVR